MELFYLKDSPFTSKTPQKRQRQLNAPKNLVTTSAYTKQTSSLKSFKFLTDDPYSPRKFNITEKGQSQEEHLKLQQIQKNLEALNQYKFLLTESQGEADEYYSRLEDRRSRLSELQETNNKIESDLKSRSEEMTQTIETLKKTLENSENDERVSIIDIKSKTQQIENLSLETQNTEKALESIVSQQNELFYMLQSIQSKINHKAAEIENRKDSIQSILSASVHLHSLFLQDQDTKFKLLEQIEKFQQIRKT